jgi:hypothetical protein
MDRRCLIRIAAGTRIAVVDSEAGHGAALADAETRLRTAPRDFAPAERDVRTAEADRVQAMAWRKDPRFAGMVQMIQTP